ncbi:uncharacterized protein TEOVI_000467600 [Trypanosoma equiperdum]|uniref:Uncharacterized protein n=1 Tax=Trypanosoma equiperdum TaxID=5694 RepID=A0A1G4I5D1_TRYEQ|nr:hypothetical protein, conserved [Trypanosoma equiperdum]
MHPFYTIRYPPSKGSNESQPILVTDTAIEPLFFCIVYSIEFQCPVQTTESRTANSRSSSFPFGGRASGGGGKREANELHVCPVENTSKLLGNVTYVSCLDHNPTLLASLQTAVDAARAIPIPEDEQKVPLQLCVRLLHKQTRWLWEESRPLVEWTFKIVKTRGLSYAAVPEASSGASARNTNVEFVHASGPAQIREVLQFILKHSYEAIDLNTFSDFKSGELVFEVFVDQAR